MSVISRAIKKHTHTPQNNELWQVLSAAWDMIPNDVVIHEAQSGPAFLFTGRTHEILTCTLSVSVIAIVNVNIILLLCYGLNVFKKQLLSFY